MNDASGERPVPEHVGSAIWWHSRTRYLLARQLAAGRRVLDLACGNGFGTVLLAEVAATVVGADVDAGAVETAGRLNARPNVRYERAAGGPLPFADAAFDLVVCLETLEHLHAHDQPAFVAELVRVLAPAGLLVLSTPDRDTELTHGRVTGAPNPFHLHTPSAAELDRLLAALPHRRTFAQLDQVATMVVPVDDAERARALAAPLVAWESRERPAPVSILHVCARTAEALAPTTIAAPVAYRADVQRLDLLAHVLTSAHLPDLRGLSVDEQTALLADRVGRLHARVEHVEREGERMAGNVSQLNQTLSLSGWLERLRRRWR